MRGMYRTVFVPAVLGFLWALQVASVPVWAESSEKPDAALQTYLGANGMLNRGLYELATAEYRSFLREHGDHEKAPVARYGLGVSLFRLKQYDKAIQELARLQDEDDFEFVVESRTLLGQAHLALHAPIDAIAAFEPVVSRHVDHDLADDAAAGLAEAQYLAKQHEDAIKTCDRFAARWGDSPLAARVLFFQGLAGMALERFDEAGEHFDTLLKRFENSPFRHQASLLLGQCHQRGGSVKKAIRQYQRVLKQQRSRYIPDALLGLAGLLQGIGETQQAGLVLDTLLENFEKSPLIPAALLQRGRVWFDLGDYEHALSAFARLSDREDKLGAQAVYFLAKCSLRTGSFDQAVGELGRAIERFPQSEFVAEMHYDRAVALVRGGKHEAASNALRGFLKVYGEHALAPDAIQLLASTEHHRGRYDKSSKQARAFLADHRSHKLAASMAFLIAENEFLSKDFEAAARSFQEFLEAFPKDSQRETATFRLGMSLFRMERFDQAGEALQRIVDGDRTTDVFRPALLALGDMYFQRSEWKRAEDYLGAYISAGLDVRAADDALLKLGLSLQRQERFEEAARVYEQLVDRFEESPHRLQAIFERGQLLTEMGEISHAKTAFQTVLDEGGDTRFAPYALNHLAALALREEDFEMAAGLYDRAARSGTRGSLQADAAFQRGMALMAAENFAEAEGAFELFISQHQEDQRVPLAGAHRAIALSRQDKHEAAIKAIAKLDKDSSSSQLEPSMLASLHYEQAWCLKALGRDEESVRAYEGLLDEGVAGDFRAHSALELAGLYMGDEEFEKARACLKPVYEKRDQAQTDEMYEASEQIAYRLGLCEFRLGHMGEAAMVFHDFVDRFEGSAFLPSVLFYAGEASYQLGRHSKAARYLTRVGKEFSDDPVYGPSKLRLGEALAAQQKWAKSERVFTSYIELFSDSDQWYQAQFGIGWAREHQKRFDEAVSAYRAVVARHQGPTAARAQFQIGECLFAQRNYDEAVRELLKVDILYAYPEWSAAALFEAGRCFEKLGKLVEARSHFKQVTQGHGGTRWADMATQRLSVLSSAGLPGQ